MGQVQYEQMLQKWGESPGRDIELRDRITQLSLNYRLASPWTSFVTVEFRRKAEREQVKDVIQVVIPQLASAAKVTPFDALADTETVSLEYSIEELLYSDHSSRLELQVKDS